MMRLPERIVAVTHVIIWLSKQQQEQEEEEQQQQQQQQKAKDHSFSSTKDG